METQNTESLFGDVIFSYSRAQAVDDGVLVDVSELAREAGFRFPVALTTSVHHLCMPSAKSHEDYKGRLWDVLNMLRFAAGRGGDDIRFKVKIGRKLVVLKALCGPGDNAEPVITIMLPEED